MTGKNRDNNISDQEIVDQGEKRRICGLCIGSFLISITGSSWFMYLILTTGGIPEDQRYITDVLSYVMVLIAAIAFMFFCFTWVFMIVHGTKTRFPDSKYLEITLESKKSIFTPIQNVVLFLDNISSIFARLVGIIE